MPCGREAAGVQTNEPPGIPARGQSVGWGAWDGRGGGLTGDGGDEELVLGRAVLEEQVREADLAGPGQGEGHAGRDAAVVGVGECDGIGHGKGRHSSQELCEMHLWYDTCDVLRLFIGAISIGIEAILAHSLDRC